MFIDIVVWLCHRAQDYALVLAESSVTNSVLVTSARELRRLIRQAFDFTGMPTLETNVIVCNTNQCLTETKLMI